MSILIKGMDKETAMRLCSYAGIWMEEEDFIEIPPHGRMIEADKLMDKIRRYGGGGLWSEEELYFTIKDMPTIIEAEK